jgi:PAS domain S-box-containing protein
MLRVGREADYSCCGSFGKLLYLRRAMGVSEPLIQASLLGEAVEHGPAAVFVADEHGRYVAVNQAACKLVGYTREELLGLGVTDIVPPEEAAGPWGEMVSDGTRRGTATLRCKDGSTIEFRYIAGATTVAGMPVYVSVGAVA